MPELSGEVKEIPVASLPLLSSNSDVKGPFVSLVQEEYWVVVVAPRPLRTLKYLFNLARGLSPVTCQWVIDCVEANSLLSPYEYALPSGTSLSGQEVRIPRRSLRSRCCLFPLPKEERVFAGARMGVLGGAAFKKEWQRLLQEAGAVVVHPSERDAQLVRGLDVVVVEGTFPLEYEVHQLCKAAAVPLVTPNWATECIITQKWSSYSSTPDFLVPEPP